MLQEVDVEVGKQPETVDDVKKETLGMGEDSQISTRPSGGDNVDDHILFSVPTRELLMSDNKQVITVGEADSTEKQSMTWEYETLATMGKEEDFLAPTRPISSSVYGSAVQYSDA